MTLRTGYSPGGGAFSAAVLGTLLTLGIVAAPIGAMTEQAQSVAPPTLSGPIASGGFTTKVRDYPFYSTPMNLKKVGYVEEEYFISGTATRYAVAAAPGRASAIGTMPYRTRILVRRPVSAANFSGVVVVDWQNVSGGNDIDSEWAYAGEFFVRSGWIWVGASVQRVGVDGFDGPNPLAGRGLKQWSPTRYGSLDVTNGGTVIDDSQSYDIYSQVGKMLKQPRGVNPLPGMKVRRIYAGGISQSASFLVRYYNSVHPVDPVYDGFLIGLGGGSPRLDLKTKLLKVLTETDVARGQASQRVPDTGVTHTWEIAGASHVGAAILSPDTNDFRAILGGLLKRDIDPPLLARHTVCARPHGSEVESWAVYSAAYYALDRWVTRDVKPSTAEPIQVSVAPAAPASITIIRDGDGIALGGIRLPRVALPTGLNTGENESTLPADALNPACPIFGTHMSFDAVKLKARYPSRLAYRRELKQVVDVLVARGFVLAADAPTLIRNADVITSAD